MKSRTSYAPGRMLVLLAIVLAFLALPIQVAASSNQLVETTSSMVAGARQAPYMARSMTQSGQHTRTVFEPGVTDEDRELISESVRLAEDFFSARFAASLGDTVTLTALPLAGPNDSGLVGLTQLSSIAIFTQSQGWIESPPVERMRTVIHEYTHAYQYSKTADVPLQSAAWFEEGVAEYLSMTAVADLGLMNREAMEGLFGVTVQLYDLPGLQVLEGLDAFQAQPGVIYPLAYLGVAYLLQDAPLSAIDDYYSALQRGSSFADAFESSFGSTPAQFYAEFAEYQPPDPAVWDGWPGELDIYEGTDRPSAVIVEELPNFVIAGQQTLVVVDALPGANCTLSLAGADSTVAIDDRDTFANGVGRAIWLLSIPEDIPSGSGTFTIACGAEPAMLTVLVA